MSGARYSILTYSKHMKCNFKWAREICIWCERLRFVYRNISLCITEINVWLDNDAKYITRKINTLNKRDKNHLAVWEMSDINEGKKYVRILNDNEFNKYMHDWI